MNVTEKQNPMMCDPVTGLCEIPESLSSESGVAIDATEKPVKLFYFTDPICSSCWGIEPQLRKLKLEYGDYFDMEYRMGGLLKSWDAYGGRDVNGPTSVAKHWEEAGAYYDMPIDGDVWLEDPLHSSYPPSIAFKAAQLQGEKKSLDFLRRIKEMVFLEKKNITRMEHLEQAAIDSGLNVDTFKADYKTRAGKLFDDDLAFARSLGVRGFPTIFFTDKEGNRLLVYGSKPYESYEDALLKLYPDAKKKDINTDHKSLFEEYPTMTTREFAELTATSGAEAQTLLNKLVKEKQLNRSTFKNGTLELYKA